MPEYIFTVIALVCELNKNCWLLESPLGRHAPGVYVFIDEKPLFSKHASLDGKNVTCTPSERPTGTGWDVFKEISQ